MAKLKPYYKQIADELEKDILAYKYRAGSRMPTEKEIQERFYVSRMTVRQAYRLLEKKGVAVIVKNKGVFVNDVTIQREQDLVSFHELIANKGLESKTKITRFERGKPEKRIARILDLDENGEVYFLTRYRYVNNELVIIEYAHIPADLVPNLSQFDFENESLYSVFKNHYGLRMVEFEDEISADIIGGENARAMLNTKSGPVLKIKTLGKLENGTPIEYTEQYANFRVFSYKTTLKID